MIASRFFSELPMGFGDQIIATGLAKGARARGERIALGDGEKIRWDPSSEQIFRNNPNLVRPDESLKASDVRWINYYKGSRLYSTQQGDRWKFNPDFRVQPGEFFFTAGDLQAAERLSLPKKFIVIEPNVKRHVTIRGSYLINKQWPHTRYQQVVNELSARGHRVLQFAYGDAPRLHNVWLIQTPSFRAAAAILSKASFYVGSEGGLHHAAAAVGTPATVLFGAWLPPETLGYPDHANLTGGATEACGLLRPCEHCAAAMNRITVDDVLAAAETKIRR